MEKKYYKVLKDGKSFHGGNLAWSLPTQSDNGEWKPGEWHEVPGDLEICENGLHLTDVPAEWWHAEAECYEAEYTGDLIAGDNKVAVKRARLTRKLTDTELEPHQIFRTGTHAVSAGRAWATDNSHVEACGNSHVRATGNSRVRATDNSHVEACDNSHVEACGNSHVRATDNSHVEACGNSHVRATDNSLILTIWIHASPVVLVKDSAIWIDRRQTPPAVHGVVTLASN